MAWFASNNNFKINHTDLYTPGAPRDYAEHGLQRNMQIKNPL